jgi:deltex-like protein
MKENKSGNVIQLRRNPPLANKPKASPIVLDDDDDSASSNKKNSGSTFADPGKAKYQAAAKLTGWKEIKKKAVPEKESCPICLLELADSNDVVQLSKCQGHMFHKDCIIHCYQQDFLKCPICSTVYGTLVGTQPKGTMTVTKSSSKLPGYKCGTITVNYYFPNGTQGPEHPNPGQAYEGTSRTGYFPDNDEGNKVVNLLKIAWDRRLIFRIGTSVTTGQENCVVWNGIHHKTSTSGGPSNYGYPDDTYLERVKDELAVKGVE